MSGRAEFPGPVRRDDGEDELTAVGRPAALILPRYCGVARILDGIPTDTLVGLRDRALIGVMATPSPASARRF